MYGHRLRDHEVIDIIHGYTVELATMAQLAKRYGITRQGVYRVLRRAGIDTSKATAWMDVSCSTCGKVFKRLRCHVRVRKHHFCGKECYFAWLHHGNGNPLLMHRHSSRIAREIVGRLFPLQEGHIVHHEDRNQYNNGLYNLRVFACQGDHVRHHRGFLVSVLWDGAAHVKAHGIR